MKWYQFDIRDLSDAEYQKWYSFMSEERKERVDRFRFLDDKKRTVAGEMLARRAIAEWCGVSAESIHFGRTEYGKPFAIDLPVEYNISHSGNVVVCAVSDSPIGIDVEEIRPVDMNIAKRFCTEDDLEYLFGYIPSDRDFIVSKKPDLLLRFFEVWTAKEAYFKRLGTGIMELKKVGFQRISKEPGTTQLFHENTIICISETNG